MKNFVSLLVLLAATNVLPLCHAQSFNVIYTFPTESVGYEPNGIPFIGAGGVLFATTADGGPNTPCSAATIGCGTVFSLTPPTESGGQWTQEVLYAFQSAPDGSGPDAGVLPQPGGTLLGTTATGGPVTLHCHYGCGTLFQLSPPGEPGAPWTEGQLFGFPRAEMSPSALLPGSNGVLYGASYVGGSKGCSPLGCGSVYELLPPAQAGGTWTRAPIHQFSAVTGSFPNSPLVADSNGVLYGTTNGGANTSRMCGSLGCGAVFSLSPPEPPATAWTYQDIYRFHGGTDGWGPATGLAIGTDGTLYGTTYFGGGIGCAGGNGCGTVFSLAPSAPGTLWTKTTLYDFQGAPDGNYPTSNAGDLVIGAGGIIYGVTQQGGGTGCNGQGCGTLFQLTPPAGGGGSWTETLLHAFTGGADGQNPFSGPAIDPTGVLYGFVNGGTGTSCNGGGCGVVYQYIP